MDLEEIGSRIFWASVGLLVGLILLRVLLSFGMKLPSPFGSWFGVAEQAAGIQD